VGLTPFAAVGSCGEVPVLACFPKKCRITPLIGFLWWWWACAGTVHLPLGSLQMGQFLLSRGEREGEAGGDDDGDCGGTWTCGGT